MENYRESGPFRALVRRTAATRAMAKLYGVIQQPLDRLVYRDSRDGDSMLKGGRQAEA